MVNQVADVTYLGVKLDEQMDGRAHAASLIKKCAGRMAFLFRNSNLLSFQNRKTLCSALVQPYLDYCCSSWYSGLTRQLKDRLDVIQRRMVRFINGFHHMHHVDSSDLKQLLWLNVEDRVRYFKLVHVFRIRLALPQVTLLPISFPLPTATLTVHVAVSTIMLSQAMSLVHPTPSRTQLSRNGMLYPPILKRPPP